MAPDALAQRLLVGSAVAREAGAHALRAFRNRPPAGAIELKGHQDYLTATDGEVEALIRALLAEAFPADGFFGEETGGTFGRAFWIVDPIDGTANFARGIPHFCVSIAFVCDGVPEIGIIFDPVHDEFYAARRGHGATLNGQPIRVSGIGDLRRATIEAGWSSRLPPEPYVALVHKLKSAGANVKRAASGALGLAYVADGRIDAYCELHINAWDALAGLVLIGEAGGWTNDFLAGDGLRTGNPVIGCTPELKDAMVGVMGLASR